MYIKYFKVVGFQGLSLNNITEFEWAPEESLILIQGPNGSGKTSLMGQMTPLPAEPADYMSGGSKHIEIEFNGDDYVLISSFKNGKPHHSFKKNDKELNQGGTITIQRDLVKEEMGFDSKLLDILMGKIKFTDMSPTLRKHWLMEISQCDFNFANNLFKEFQTNSRDLQGALKVAKTNVIKEKAKLMDLGQLDGLKTQVTELNKAIHSLLDMKEPTVGVDILKTEMRTLMESIKEDTNTIKKANVKLRHLTGFKGPVELLEHSSVLKQRVVELSSLSKAKSDELLTVQDILDKFSSGSINREELTRSKKQLEEDHIKMDAEIAAHYAWDSVIPSNPEQALSRIPALLDDIANATHHVSNPIKPEIDRAGYDAAVEKYKEHDVLLAKAKFGISKLGSKLEHIESCVKVECVKCSHKFIVGVDEDEIPKLKAEIKRFEEEVVTHEEALEKLSVTVASYERYMSFLRSLKMMMQDYPAMEVYWLRVKEERHFDFNVDYLRDTIPWFKNLCERTIEMNKISAKIDAIHEQLKMLDDLGEMASGDMAGKADSLATEIAEYNHKLREAQLESDHMERSVRTYRAMQEAHDSLTERVKRMDALQVELTKAIANKGMEAAIDEMMTRVSSLNVQLNAKDTLDNLIGDLERQIDEMEKQKKAWDLLVTAMSPASGIIADQMGGFIKDAVDNMNSALSMLWEYDMEILPCINSKGEIDYKFPISIVNRAPRPDVSRTSLGQREVIDFVFVLIVIKYKGLQEYPFYIDEVGSNFDVRHRTKLLEYIKVLVNSKSEGQTILINHYASFSGALSNVERIVLDKHKHAITKDTNKNVKMS